MSPEPTGPTRALRNPVRFVTAASLFDGHDASINIMRRILQAQGCEVIHLGHDRSVDQVVRAVLQEDVQGVAISSYQGGHVEYFSYLRELLDARGAHDVKIYGGGGGVIVPDEIALLAERGVRIFSPEDGQRLGLVGMISSMVAECDTDLAASPVDLEMALTGHERELARAITVVEEGRAPAEWAERIAAAPRSAPVLGITGTGGSGKSSLTDELLRRETEPITDEIGPDSLDAQVVPSGPGFAGENNLRLFLALLYYAQERIVITSPYFVPDESMLTAITTATQRGIAVELFVSEIGDQALVYHAQRSYYEVLLRAGVKIWMYKAPYILHAKHFTIDDDVAVIGSSNMDMRSFQLNMEVSLMVRGRSFVTEMRAVEDGYRRESRELTLDEWMKQPLRSTVLDNLARLTSALQ